MREVMIDIETLSTLPNASIVTIGAIQFNRHSGHKEIGEMNKFYRRINYVENHDFHVDDDTVSWWIKQDRDVKYEALENTDRISLPQALQELSSWIGKCEIIWANSPSFDCVILENAYRACGIPIPWKYWNTRDVRTIMDVSNTTKTNYKEKHNALVDCYNQILEVKKAFKNLKQ